MSKRQEKAAAKWQALKAKTEEENRKPEDPHYEYDNRKGKWVPKK